MKLVSLTELATILDLDKATVRERVKSGEWPCYIAGEKSIRFDLDELKTLLRSPGKGSSVKKHLASESGSILSNAETAKKSKE